MALIKYGALISEARGKEAGIIFSRNAYGGYVKQKVSPVNPQTSYQQVVRGQLGTAAQQWSGLTDEQKEAWNELGTQILRVNRFGDQTYYTGFNLFVKVNRNRAIMGLSAIEVPALVPAFPTLSLTVLTLEQTGGTVNTVALTWTLTGGDPAANFRLALDMTPSILTGRKFVKNYYRHVSASPAESSPLEATTAYTSRFSDITVTGAMVGARARLIDEASGLDTAYSVIQSNFVEV